MTKAERPPSTKATRSKRNSFRNYDDPKKVVYANAYRNIDFRQHPEKYVIGRGEQGVLIAQPYKGEILPYWKFATPEKARQSAEKIYELFNGYKDAGDFVGMDMARKFLQMGFTRSRRYANHASGDKYAPDGSVNKQDADSEGTEKAESARIFYGYYVKAKDDAEYRRRLQIHKNVESSVKSTSDQTG